MSCHRRLWSCASEQLQAAEEEVVGAAPELCGPLSQHPVGYEVIWRGCITTTL